MPLAQLANGPMSAVCPTLSDDLHLDELHIEEGPKKIDEEFHEELIIETEEKPDTSHFALLKVLGQGQKILLSKQNQFSGHLRKHRFHI